MNKSRPASNRVIVTGLGAVTPFGLGVAALEDGLFSGRPAIRKIEGFDASELAVRIAGEVPDFDPADHLSRRAARRSDRFAQFAIAASREAVASAGLTPGAIASDRVGVVIHTGAGGIPALVEGAAAVRERGHGLAPPLMIARYTPNMASSQVSIAIGTRGPALTGVGACASGTMAMIEALQLIRRGEVDIAIAGGAEACVTAVGIAGFDNLGVLSHRNDDPGTANRPFSRDRDGTVLSEGACVVVMESEDHARRRGAQALAEVVSGAVTSDGYHLTAPDPTGDYLAKAMRMALERGGISPDEVDLVSAHATASQAGDIAEVAAIKQVFGEKRRPAVTATKSMVGHMIGGAGALAVLGVVLGMKRGQISPTINLYEQDPECEVDAVPNVAREAAVRVALANGIGFGGQNAVVAIRTVDP
jgi:3-oxoacyl-[acyl-carrier-protein] synthase II